MPNNDKKLIGSPSTPGKKVQSKTMRSSSGVEVKVEHRTEWPPTPQLPKRSLRDVRKTMSRGSEAVNAEQLTNNVKKLEDNMTRSRKNNLEKLTGTPSTPGKKVQSKTMKSRSGVDVKADQLTNNEKNFEDSMTRSVKKNLEKLMGPSSTRGKKVQSKTMRSSSRVEVKVEQMTELPPAPQLLKRRRDPRKTMRRGSEVAKAEQLTNNLKKVEDSMTRSMRNNLEKLVGSPSTPGKNVHSKTMRSSSCEEEKVEQLTNNVRKFEVPMTRSMKKNVEKLIGSPSTPGKKVQCKSTRSGVEAKSWQLKRKRNVLETMRRGPVPVKAYGEPRPLSSLPPKKRGCSTRDLKELEMEASRRSPHVPLKPIRTVEGGGEVLMSIQGPEISSGSSTSANDHVRDGKDKTIQTVGSKSKEKSSNAPVAKESNLPPEQKARVNNRRRRYIIDSDSSSYGC